MDSVLNQINRTSLSHYIRQYFIQLTLISLITYLVFKYVKENWYSNLPPGPMGLPFFGYRPFLGNFPQKKLMQLSKKYGHIMSLRLGPKLVVVVSGYERLRDVFANEFVLDRPKEIFDHILKSGFGVTNGKEWEEQRRFCMQSVKDLGFGRGHWEVLMQDEVSSFIEELKSTKGKPSEMTDQLSASVNNNVLSLLIGRRLKSKDKEMKLANDYSYISVNLMPAHSIVSMMPVLRKYFERFRIGGYHRAAEIVSDFTDLMTQEIRKHKMDSDHTTNSDFINQYLNKTEVMHSQNKKHYFSDENLDGNLKVLFLGGADTIFVSLMWLFRLMAAYPEIQSKVHNELDDVIGTDGRIAYEDRFKIPYTFAVLMEAQRYSTIAPMPLREVSSTFQLGDYTIPKGSHIIGNVYQIHRDHDFWIEPEEFNPDRFLTEDKKKFYSNAPSFVPFSIGRRNCPGEAIAWMEILGYFSAVMQRFSISTPPGVAPEFKVIHGIISRLKQQPLCFVERT